MSASKLLIIEFMDGVVIESVGVVNFPYKGSVGLSELKYSTSWDCLIPVIQKINKRYSDLRDTEHFIEMDPIYQQLKLQLSLCSLEGVFVFIILFLEWHKTIELP